GFDSLERSTKSLSEDEEDSLRFDVSRTFSLARGEASVQFGGKSRMREKSYDFQGDVFDVFDGDFSLAEVVGPQSYGLAVIDPLPSGLAVREFFARNAASFELDPIESLFISSVEDYLVEEDVHAAYVLG